MEAPGICAADGLLVQSPLWAAYILFCRDIELACDERVVRGMGPGQRADYSQALLECSTGRRALGACPLAFGEVGVKARVKAALHYKKPAFWAVAGALVLCAVVAVVFLTDPLTPRYDFPKTPLFPPLFGTMPNPTNGS